MSRYPWRDTSSDIAGGQPPQWETPGGAQAKADKAEAESKKYTDEKNADFTAHVQNTTIHVTQSDKDNWNSKAPGVHTHPNATPTTPGFESAADKTKLDGIEEKANNYVHPTTHPPSIIAQDVSNRFVTDAEKAAWSAKAETTVATPAAKGLMAASDKSKLDGIEAGAEVNQNAFSMLKAPGQADVVAGSKQETINFAGGTGITVTTDPASRKVMITATGEATPGPHASSHITGGTDIIPDAVTGGSSGLMSGADADFVRNTGETKTGAQKKADAAVATSKTYTDTEVSTLSATVAEKTQDASLTKKGITQLSKAVDGARDNVAAAESAVKVAYDLANSRETVSGAQTKANTAETNAKNYVDAKSWQKFKLTGDTGATIPKYLVSMNTLTDTGVYSGTGFTDSPDGTAGTFTVIVLKGGSDRDFLIQIAIKFDSTNGISTYMRTRRDATWYGWTRDLTDASVSILSGTGSPEGSVTAPPGYLYRNLNGGANTTLYVKQTGTGNTGWAAK